MQFLSEDRQKYLLSKLEMSLRGGGILLHSFTKNLITKL